MAKLGDMKITNPINGKTEQFSVGGFIAGVVGVVVILTQVSLGQKVAKFIEDKTKIDTSPSSLTQAPAQVAQAGITSYGVR